MKKAFSLSSGLLLQVAAFAQEEKFDPLHDRSLYFDSLNIFAILAVIYLISAFITTLVKTHLAHRLKTRIIDKQVSEPLVRQLLVPERKDRGQSLIQWCAVLTSIAVGLVLVRFTLPFGLHSLAILAAALAAGCAAAYFFSRREAQLQKPL